MADRLHGTHACYVHGPTGVAAGRGCRCDLCRAANREYEAQRARRTEPPYVDATEVREHIAWLAAHGVGLKTIAARSAVSHGALWKIVYGKPGRGPSKRCRPATRDAILAIKPSDGADGARVPAAPTWAHVATLLERGWTKASISAAIGQDGRSLQLGRQQVQRRTARAIAALLDQPVPEGLGTTRATADRQAARARAVSSQSWQRKKAEARLAATPTTTPPRSRPLAPLLDATGYTAPELARAVSASGSTIQRWAVEGIDDTAVDRICSRLELNVTDIWDDGYDLPTLDLRLDLRSAPCRRPEVPTRLFFPDARDTETIAAAKAICATCRWSDRCLAFAVAHGEQGIWGGTTDAERRALGAVA